jgi:hypothetical protein
MIDIINDSDNFSKKISRMSTKELQTKLNKLMQDQSKLNINSIEAIQSLLKTRKDKAALIQSKKQLNNTINEHKEKENIEIITPIKKEEEKIEKRAREKVKGKKIYNKTDEKENEIPNKILSELPTVEQVNNINFDDKEEEEIFAEEKILNLITDVVLEIHQSRRLLELKKMLHVDQKYNVFNPDRETNYQKEINSLKEEIQLLLNNLKEYILTIAKNN